MRLTEEEFAKMMLQKGKEQPAPPPKSSKYGSVMEECQGIKFQSRREAKYFRELQARQYAGEVSYFLRQFRSSLSAGAIPIDFMEVWKDGSIHWVDVKGFRTKPIK